MHTHYFVSDIRDLMVSSAPYLALSNESLLGFLRRTAKIGEAYENLLPQYPCVACEPLEGYYRYSRNARSLNALLARDLLLRLSWREANWGAWLCVLTPDRAYIPLLQASRTRLPHSTTIIDLAIVSCCGKIDPLLEEHHELAINIKRLVSLVKCKPQHLRPSPSPLVKAKYKAEVQRLRVAYLKKDDALVGRMLKSGLIGYYNQGLTQWTKDGCLPPPLRASPCLMNVTRSSGLVANQ